MSICIEISGGHYIHNTRNVNLFNQLDNIVILFNYPFFVDNISLAIVYLCKLCINMSNGCVEGDRFQKLKHENTTVTFVWAVTPHSSHVRPEVKYGLVEKCEMSFEYLYHWPIFVQETSCWMRKPLVNILTFFKILTQFKEFNGLNCNRLNYT